MDTGKLPAETLNKLLAKTRTAADVIVGPAYGEDAAAVRFGGRVLVAASDPVTFATDRIGHYAVSVNANDIAVMGATPLYFLATILLPEGSTEAQAEAVFADIETSCRSLDVSLIGGHTEVTSAVNCVVVSGCMLGEVDEDRLVRASGARVGDVVILIGGIAIEGSAILAREAADDLRAAGASEEAISAAAKYLDDPGICIVHCARLATAAGEVHAMHDPTEGGLASALRELAAASGHGIVIDRSADPILGPCAEICAALGVDPLGLIASGSLLVATSPGDGEKIRNRLARERIPSEVIGVVVDDRDGVTYTDGAGLPSFGRDEIARYYDERQARRWEL